MVTDDIFNILNQIPNDRKGVFRFRCTNKDKGFTQSKFQNRKDKP